MPRGRCGAGFPRTAYATDRTGHNLLNTLFEQAISRNLQMYEDFFVTSLVMVDHVCTGCTALEMATGEMHGFVSGAVLCATGGFGRIYERSTNALINTDAKLADVQKALKDANINVVSIMEVHREEA